MSKLVVGRVLREEGMECVLWECVRWEGRVLERGF
jgi:hypothetical protein